MIQADTIDEREPGVEDGLALVFALFLTVIAAGLSAFGLMTLRATRSSTETYFAVHGQARQVARSGLTEALSWLRTQNTQPVKQFEPRLDPTVTPPVLETIAPEIGLVREYRIRGDLWGRYEVWRSWPDDPDPQRAAMRSALAARDVSARRSTASSVSSWAVRSIGYVYRRKSGTASFDAPPNRVIARETLEAEYTRPLFQLPAQAGISGAMGGPIVVGPNTFVYGGSGAAGIYYQSGTGSPNTLNGITTGTPSLAPATSFSCDPVAVFGVSEATLRTMATYYVTDADDFPVPVPNFAIVFVDESVRSLTFSAHRPLLGKGLVYVKGNVTVRSGSDSSFQGLLYMCGDLTVHGKADLSGTIIANKGVLLNGATGPVTVTYDSEILAALQLHFGSYHVSAPVRPVYRADD